MSSARKVMSRRFPIGVATTYNVRPSAGSGSPLVFARSRCYRWSRPSICRAVTRAAIAALTATLLGIAACASVAAIVRCARLRQPRPSRRRARHRLRPRRPQHPPAPQRRLPARSPAGRDHLGGARACPGASDRLGRRTSEVAWRRHRTGPAAGIADLRARGRCGQDGFSGGRRPRGRALAGARHRSRRRRRASGDRGRAPRRRGAGRRTVDARRPQDRARHGAGATAHARAQSDATTASHCPTTSTR